MSAIDQAPVPADSSPPAGPLARPGQRALAPRPYREAPAVAIAAPDEEDFIDLRHLWGILLRRKGTILLVAALAVLQALEC